MHLGQVPRGEEATLQKFLLTGLPAVGDITGQGIIVGHTVEMLVWKDKSQEDFLWLAYILGVFSLFANLRVI